jgi:branched-chain amino acid aminotransferase
MPPRIKCSANYQNGRLAALEARAGGYDYTVLLNLRGKVAEAPGAALFMVRGGVPATPPVTADVLESITRVTLIQLLRERHGLAVAEREIDRTELCVADEAFFCGSGWEITPIGSVDRIPLRVPAPGPVTRAIRDTYFTVVRGEMPEYRHWLTPVYGRG